MNQFISDYKNKNKKTIIVSDITQYKKVTDFQNTIHSFSILQQNIRSIAKNFDNMTIFLNQLDHDFDVIILTETWHIADKKFFNLNGYEMIYNQGNINQSDGVVMYIKDIYNHDSTIQSINNIRSIVTKLTYLGKRITVTAIYRPPSTCPHVFNNDIRTHLKNDKESADYKFIIGDINIDILSCTDCSNEYLNILSEAGYKSLINTYTRVVKQSKSCIDHIFVKTKEELDNFAPIVYEKDITDHYTTINIIRNTGKSAEPNLCKRKFVKRLNQQKLALNLRQLDFCNEIIGMGTEEAADFFIDKIKFEITKATTLVKVKPCDIKRKEWITAGLARSSNHKQELFKAWKNDVDNMEIKNKYLAYKNAFNTLIKATKINYYKSLISNKPDSKTLWNTVNKITSNSRKNNEIKHITNAAGEKVSTRKEIADTLNQHYTNVGKKLANAIKKSHHNFESLKDVNPNTIFIRPTDEAEVKKFMKELKTHKAPGMDNITSEILKQNADILAPALTIIINKIFVTNIVPKSFKVAVITPLHKAGDKTHPENYRPISIISNLAKLFEKILKKRLVQFLNKYEIISPSQFGFRAEKSTQDALIGLTNEIQEALDSNKRSLCVFIDLAKAFDTVNHLQLLQTLDDIGIRGSANKLMENYLKDRHQYVKIGNVISEKMTVKYGVPQGTVLGPVLFTIYVNDLFKLQSKGKIVAFADDTAILYVDKTWDSLKEKVEEDIQLIKNWFDHKILTINLNKTKYVTFTCHNYNLPTFNNIQVPISHRNKVTIESVESIKYLGVYIDKHLKWHVHIEKLIKKLRGILFKFKTLKQILDTKTLKIIYYGMVQSLLQYGIVVWGSTSNNYMNSLEIIHKRFLKIMFDKEYQYPTELLYAETKMDSLRQLYFKSLVVHQFKNKKDIKKAEHKYTTRNKANEISVINRTKKQIGLKSCSSLGPRMYNNIPKEVRTSITIAEFKNKLKKWMAHKNNQYFVSLINKYI